MRIRKVLLPLVVMTLALVGWGLAAAAPAVAKDVKPVVAVSFAGYDKLKADIGYVGQIADRPGLHDQLESVLKLFTQGKGLAGLDQTRPWGVVVQTDGTDFSGYAFIPVKDLKELLGVLAPFVGEAKDAGHGVLEIKKGAGKAVYVVERSGWALLSDKPENLTDVPTDPAAVIADMNKQYDLAVRVLAANLPDTVRRQAVDKIKSDVARDLNRRPNESEQEHAVRTKVTEEVSKSLLAVLNDLDQVTIGLSLDTTTGKSFLDVNVVAKPGSETARQAAALAETKTDFAGFELPAAAVCGNWAGKIPESKVKVLEVVVDAARDQALKDIEKSAKPDDEKQLAKDLASNVFEVVEQTVKSGRLDGGMAVLLDPKAATFVAGQHVTDAARLDKLAARLAEFAEKANPVVGQWIKLNADQLQSIKFHTVSIPLPGEGGPKRDRAAQVLGETIEVAIGIGPNSLYVAAGRDALKTLKTAITSSLQEAAKTVPPLHVSVAMRPIAEFVAAVGREKDQAKAKQIAAELAKSDKADHINLTATQIANGVRYRLDVDPGLLKVLIRLGTVRATP